MFANLTEETCTGTGNVLTLLGATAGNRPYSRGFDDGALASYVVKDSAGVITASGIGTYATAANTITRNDSENDNGTITDKNPATNIALSAGTHTITCDVVSERLISSNITAASIPSGSRYHVPDNFLSQDYEATPSADRAVFVCGLFLSPRTITSFAISIETLAISSNTRQAIYSCNADGSVGKLLVDSGNIDISTTGLKITNLAQPLKLSAGQYWFGVVTDNAVARWKGVNNSAITNCFMQPSAINIYNSGRPQYPYLDAVTGAFPETLTPTGHTASLPLTAGFR